MRLVPVGVDPDLFKPLPTVQRIPGRLITTASADVALKGLSYLLEAVAKLRTERDVTLTIIGKPKPGKSMDLIDKLGLAPHIQFISDVTDERIVELYAQAELAVVPDRMADEVSRRFSEAALIHGRASTTALDQSVTIVPVSVVKGLELDGVVVVEPADIVEAEIQGMRSLYVALTRATQRLTVVHARALPDAML